MQNLKITRNLEHKLALTEQGRELRNIYYDSIGQEYTPHDRQIKNAQPRFAFAVALARHLNDTVVGDVIEKDRTTIIHYRKNHNDNMKYWSGYSLLYDTAEYVVDSYFKGSAKLERLKYIDEMVATLLKEKQTIQSQLNEQLQIQDH